MSDRFNLPTDWPKDSRCNRLRTPNALRVGQVILVPIRLLKRVRADLKMLSACGDLQLAGGKVEVG